MTEKEFTPQEVDPQAAVFHLWQPLHQERLLVSQRIPVIVKKKFTFGQPDTKTELPKENIVLMKSSSYFSNKNF